MPEAKNSRTASVHIGYDGKVHKSYRDRLAEERMATEVAVLKHLSEQNCSFVPKLIEVDWENKKIVTTNCGTRVQHLSDKKIKSLFAQLERFGDFEFATLLDHPEISLKPKLPTDLESPDG